MTHKHQSNRKQNLIQGIVLLVGSVLMNGEANKGYCLFWIECKIVNYLSGSAETKKGCPKSLIGDNKNFPQRENVYIVKLSFAVDGF